MLTGRITYALAEESLLVRGILGSPAPASMWTGWSWRTLHTSLETIARRFGFRVVTDEEAERLISDGPDLIVQAGDVAVSLRHPPERVSRRRLGALDRSLREPYRASSRSASSRSSIFVAMTAFPFRS